MITTSTVGNTNKTVMEVRKLKLAVSGLTGAGKSTILNSIVGKEVFVERHHIHHETLKVTSHTWSDDDNNFEVTVFDTPGFEDDCGDAENYKADIKNNCGEVDLLLYCISVEDSGIASYRDRKALSELQQVFGSAVWKHCVVVLTFANAIAMRLRTKYSAKLNSKAKVRTKYQAALKNWKKEIRKMLHGCLGEEIGQNIPIIPAANANDYSILKDNKYWLSELFRKVLEITEDDKSDVLIMLNSHRFRSVSSVKKREFDDVRIIDQPLVIHDDFHKLKKRLKNLRTAVGVGSITGAVGATIGATIGALAIGLPTVGIGAGVGLGLGAAIGGVIGMGVLVGVYRIVNKFEEMKHFLDPNVNIMITEGFI